eukprot:COSAG02_NODE_60637_length_270_cov_2.116959_1_plen_44_part_10
MQRFVTVGVDPPIYRDFYSLVYYLMLPICIHLYLFVQLVNPGSW